ncbi:MAG: A/G-specific adenine glycosylase [Chthoniobacterales bacterium]|nr:A/G-specific adenine glycosylase [Chthoniobacterales bacterium]
MDVRRSTFDVRFIDSATALDAGSFRRSLLSWYRKNGRDLPWRHTRDPYAILVSELMLQQTQVTTVIPFYTEWLRRFPDVKTLAAASEPEVLHAWQGLGYYARARNLHAAAKALVENYGGLFPSAAAELQKLPGVGRYTANAVSTFAFNSSLPIVEANTARLFARLQNIQTRIDSGTGRQRLWDFAISLIPERNAAAHNSALMDLGAMICVGGEPKCSICPVRAFCCAENPAMLPIKAARTPLKLLTEHHRFSSDNSSVLLEQSRGRWRGMWILPRLTSVAAEEPVLYSADFPFTHHRITLRVCAAPPQTRAGATERAFSFDEVHAIPMPSPHRRALNALLQQHSAAPN